ncbi:MAG: OmpA family protein [Pseudomonadales bacterium]|nr:OmpA family protein [Pseudomonadales bacterium]
MKNIPVISILALALNLPNCLAEPSAVFHKEPSAVLYKEPSAALYEQPSAALHEQPSAVFHEQPSAVFHEQPSAVFHEQPSAVFDEQPSTVAHIPDTEKEEYKGAVAGMVIGAAIAGPLGAGIGSIVGGAVFGKLIGSRRVVNELQAAIDNQRQEDRVRRRNLRVQVAKLSRELNQKTVVKQTQRQQMPVRFETNSAVIGEHYVARLNEVAKLLRKNELTHIVLSGFADRRGSTEFNQTLSERRVAAVRAYLVGHGVGLNQISGQGFGETKPMALSQSIENNFLDRRVELQFGGDEAVAFR